MVSEVIMKTECLHVKRGGIELVIRQGDKTFGTLTVSNATVSWFPKHAQKAIKMSWKSFDEKMIEQKEAK